MLGVAAQICERIAVSFGISSNAVSSTLAIISLASLAILVVHLLHKLGILTYSAHGNWIVITTLVACYSICSSMLLILNKVAVTYVPAPSFILTCQLGSCALFVKAMAVCGIIEAEPLQWEKSKKFGLIVFGFIGTLLASVTSLRFLPVDTIICFRASCPLIIAIIEYLYLDRELPSARSWVSLLGVFSGVAMYTYHDIHFTVIGYLWLSIWYSFAVFEMFYVKKIVDTVDMTTWSRTYYQNSLATLPMVLIMVMSNEMRIVATGSVPSAGSIAVTLSCICGVGMSYFSFALRAVISATSFSVIGNICKVLTILVNTFMWDQHSSPMGIGALLLCLAMGSIYQQAPKRSAAVSQLSLSKVEHAGLLPK